MQPTIRINGYDYEVPQGWVLAHDGYLYEEGTIEVSARYPVLVTSDGSVESREGIQVNLEEDEYAIPVWKG